MGKPCSSMGSGSGQGAVWSLLPTASSLRTTTETAADPRA